MRQLLLWIIKFYQKCISPFLAPRCRYFPTCSVYAIESLERHGALRGSFIGLCRLLRCNPLFSGGVDLVPNKMTNTNSNTARSKG